MAKKKTAHVVKDHVLIPQHDKLSDKEKAALLAQYHVTIRELPKINKTDNAIASLDAKEGDVIRIIRKSPTSGESVFYRVVLDV